VPAPSRALLAGLSALRALRGPAHGFVEVVIDGGAYLRLDTGWVLVAGPRAPLGPLSVTVSGLRAGDPVAAAGDEAHSDGRVLAVGGLRVALPGVRPPRRPLVASGVPAGGVSSALRAAVAACPAPPAELEPGLRALAGRSVAQGRGRPGADGSTSAGVHGQTDAGVHGQADAALAVALLAGRGDGLTPAGDDVLAGFAAWRHADGAPILLSDLAADGSSALGLAYLRCAERGELTQPAARVLASVRRGDAAGATTGARELRRWGSSSGAALLWGMAAAGDGRTV
jgi:Protein of unknown function (DUF2877)